MNARVDPAGLSPQAADDATPGKRGRTALVREEAFARLAYRPKDAGAVLGVSQSTIYEMIAEGKLKAKKIGAATVIPHSELKRVLDEAPYSEVTMRALASNQRVQA